MFYCSKNSYLKVRRVKTTLLTFLFLTFIKSQVNLIPNPSFELTNSQINNCFQYGNITNLKDWYSVLFTPDVFNNFSSFDCNNCPTSTPLNSAGFQNPKSGNSYLGIINRSLFTTSGYPKYSNATEIVGVKLNKKLDLNHIYKFSLFYSIAESSKFINNQLSAYFSINQTSISTNSFFPPNQNWYDWNLNNIKPQVNNDTTNYLSSNSIIWSELSGCFISNGTEEHLAIGNFRDGTLNKVLPFSSSFTSTCNSSVFDGTYLYIDDVSLYDMGYYSGKAQAKNDTTLCTGIAHTIGNNIKDSSIIVWQPSAGLGCTNCPNPIANPTVTTKYYVTKTLCSFITKDSITLTVYTPTAIAKAGANATLCVNETLQLGTNDVNSYSTYNWQPNTNLSCNNCPQPIVKANSTITYTLTRQECNSQSQSTVDIIIDNCELLLPQGVSDNNDGINDNLMVVIPNAQSATLTVFNRWGSELYSTSSNSYTNSKYPLSIVLTWDAKAHKGIIVNKGELVPTGTYFYLVEVTQNNGEKKVYKEFVQVVH